MATSTAADLWYRLSDALGTHDAHPDERDKIQQAYLDAGGNDATWSDLPPDIQTLIQEIEKRPAQSWEDPADVPDDPDNQ